MIEGAVRFEQLSFFDKKRRIILNETVETNCIEMFRFPPKRNGSRCISDRLIVCA